MQSKKTSGVTYAALLALAVVGAFFLAGCGKEEPAQAPASSTEAKFDPPEVYMKDPAFLKKLDVQKKERNHLLTKRCEIDEALQAEKAKDPSSPKVKELQFALDAADREFESNRLATVAIVRERLMRKKGKTK